MVLIFWLLSGHVISWVDAIISGLNLLLTLALGYLFLLHRRHSQQRAQLYETVSSQAEHARSLSRISAFALQIDELSQFADLLCRKVARQLNLPFIGLFAVREASERIQLYAGLGWNDGLVGCIDQPYTRDSHLSFTISTGETTTFTDLLHDQRFGGPKFLRDHGIVSGIGAIIPSGNAGKPWGILAVYTNQSRIFSPEESFYLESAARIFGSALSLRTSERRYRLLSESGNDLVVTFNTEGQVTWIAPSCERMLGYSPRELMGMKRFTLIHPEDAPVMSQILEKPQPVDASARVRIKPKNGDWIWIDFRFSPLLENGTFVGLRAMGRDITREVESQLIQEHLFSMTAHELRTPLSVLKGYAQLIARGKLDQGQIMTYAEKITQGVDEVTGLIDGMLEIDPTGRAGQKLESVELCKIVRDEIHRYESYHPEHKGRFEIERPRGDVIGVWDKGRVGRTIFNLIENAAKYSSEAIQVSVRADGSSAYVDVADHGMGISADEQQKIFQPYFRSQRNEARNSSGMGLGLTIAESAIKLHGGSISVDSHIGHGTTMTITLPLNPPQGG